MSEMKPLTFDKPDAFKMDKERGYKVVDRANSEFAVRMEALGTPAVHYMAKANKYYKDPKCTNEFSDEEIRALELPIPAEIENERRKRIKAANDSGKAIDFLVLYAETSPSSLKPPKHIRDRLVTNDPIERMLQRVNKSTLGR